MSLLLTIKDIKEERQINRTMRKHTSRKAQSNDVFGQSKYDRRSTPP
jgi:hypothetical protein